MDLQLEKLVSLQQIDGTIARLTAAIADLPKALELAETKIQHHRQAVANADKEVLAEEARRRRLESDLKDQQQKIAKYRDQSSSVKTNEQFRALQHEIGFVEAEIRRIEDADLTSMIQSEALENKRNEAKKELALQMKLVEQQREKARATSVEQQQELTTLRQERSKLRQEVAEDLLAQYDRIASSSRKTALARASGRRCLACQMAMRPQFWNQVREGILLNCESCGRMLYFDPALEPAPTSPSPLQPS